MRCICKNGGNLFLNLFGSLTVYTITPYGTFAVCTYYVPLSMVTRNKWTNKNEDGGIKSQEECSATDNGNGNCIAHNCILQILFLFS